MFYVVKFSFILYVYAFCANVKMGQNQRKRILFLRCQIVPWLKVFKSVAGTSVFNDIEKCCGFRIVLKTYLVFFLCFHAVS